MIDISNISKKKIKDFAGEVIFNRGLDYFRDDMVEDFEYDPKLYSFQAMVHGSYGFYDIEICNNQNHLEANCNCPYDGYPCKHIVAVLLYFLENKNKYLKELKKQNDLESIMNRELSGLSKDELIKMILSFSKNHSTIKRELLLHLSIDSEKSFKSFEKTIDKIFFKFERDSFSTYEISRELKKILKQVETANPDFQIEVLWKVLNGVLFQLNEYGMNDIPFEDLAMNSLNKLVDLFQAIPGLKEKNPEIIHELEEYCEWRNCGIADEICEAYFTITEDED
jgi:uncharacterized Zn finger protein